MNNIKKNISKVLSAAVVVSALALQSCTDLTEPVYDAIPADQFLKTDAQVAAALGPAYSGMRGITWDWFNPSEATSDELIVPTRGGDWFDNGDWLAYSRHTWTPQHGPINGMWGFIFGNISQVNQLLNVVKTNKAAVDELRAIRAFYYFMAVDAFGNVPIVTDNTSSAATKSRAEVYAFIEKELTEAIPSLPAGKAYSRMTQDAATMLLAKLYLNAGVYKGSPEWQKAYDTIDKVIKSKNGYSLAATTLANFTTQNQSSPEAIFNIPFDSFLAGGLNFQMRTLHYANQQTYGLGNAPWNGFCTLADFYNSFDKDDARSKMWLVGQQYSASGAPLKDAKDQPLAFIPDFNKDQMTDADPEFQVAGVRSQKYEIQRNNPNGDQDNDYVFFRLADAILMRAEAAFRLGKTADALADVNTIRARSLVAPLKSVTAADILAERGRELAWEGWRRNDMIRFGTFSTSRKFMKVVDKTRELFPIPQARIDANPLLKQNPGY
ncbi:RagB/SusD domain-containing protein [Emticicia oligotrophica DSM 17448]|uniref:RagB/SusD domain-containing protein n=1 Tax=Emticicia oligotrophica (strain DSM 17448 / CIP 109782 / MTCC 6937 / GPTSA100-15) TaxID=929562 RepID=A0ABM5MZY7_EMTOG|nr:MULTISPECIES: RagB/SusD family nutrient uptake outer membrane protein [Emticicia]AFK02770.1 RagB/SusD domain-containing protein [Emticicia oligotrophica DSM 17448]